LEEGVGDYVGEINDLNEGLSEEIKMREGVIGDQIGTEGVKEEDNR
jgi:hypothetical protein